jgi:hypothetical protein
MAYPAEGYVIEDMFPAKLPTDHLDLQTRWFRRHFVGKAYATFVGQNHIISVVREEAREFCGPGNAAAKLLGQQYRIIIRTNKVSSVTWQIITLLDWLTMYRRTIVTKLMN